MYIYTCIYIYIYMSTAAHRLPVLSPRRRLRHFLHESGSRHSRPRRGTPAQVARDHILFIIIIINIINIIITIYIYIYIHIYIYIYALFIKSS